MGRLLVEQIIRPMEGVDVEHVLQLAKAMHQEGAYAFIEFDNRTMINTIVGCMENPDSFAYVGTIDGEVASAFLGYITTYFFSAERMSEEIGMFTLKKHRKTRLGFKLLKEFISWSKEKGVTEVSIGLSHGFETTYARRLGKFLEKRLGFTEGGIWYKLRG